MVELPLCMMITSRNKPIPTSTAYVDKAPTRLYRRTKIDSRLDKRFEFKFSQT